MHLHEIVLMFIKNNAWFIIPFLTLFILISIKNTKARRMAYFLIALALGFCFVYLFNKLFGHNSMLRGACLSLVDIVCSIIQIVEAFVLVNTHVIALVYSAGLLTFIHDTTFELFLSGTIDLMVVYYFNLMNISNPFSLKLKKELDYVALTNIDFNKDSNSFLQVMRV